MYSLLIILVTLYGIYQSIATKDAEESLKWFLLAFFFGYRSIRVYGSFDVHPLDLILVAMAFKTLINLNTRSVKIPGSLLTLIPFAVMALFIGRIMNPGMFDKGLAEFKGFMVVYLLFIVFGHYLQERKHFVYAMKYFYFSMFLVALIGVIEYYVPPADPLIRAFFGASNRERFYIEGAEEGFTRAFFMFWGTSTVANIMVVVLPFIFVLFRSVKSQLEKIYYYISFPILLLAIYISGNRAGWIAFIFMLLFVFVFYVNKRFKAKQVLRIYLIGGLIVFFGINSLLSADGFVERFGSGLAVLDSEADEDATDGSTEVRKQRIEYAIERIKMYPLGNGWTGSGWVHSDFLQITGNMGWIPGIIFFFSFFHLFYIAFKRAVISSRYKNNFDMDLIYALFLAYFGTAVQWAMNVNYPLSQSGIPLFTVWAMLYTFIIRFDRGDFEEEDRRAKLKQSAA